MLIAEFVTRIGYAAFTLLAGALGDGLALAVSVASVGKGRGGENRDGNQKLFHDRHVTTSLSFHPDDSGCLR